MEGAQRATVDAMSVTGRPTEVELAAMLRAVRGVTRADAPPPFAPGARAKAILLLCLFSVVLATFPHADAGRPFLLRHGETVSPSMKPEEEMAMSRMRAVRSFVAGSLAVGSSMTLASEALANLVVGGDFESVPQGGQGSACHSSLLPFVPGWESNLGYRVDRRGIAGCEAGCTPLNPNGGNFALSLQGSVCCGCDNNGFIQQTLPTIAGTRYQLTFDVILDETDVLRVSVDNASHVFTWSGKLEWQTVSLDFDATGSSVLRFASESPASSSVERCWNCIEGEGCELDNIIVIAAQSCPGDVTRNGSIDGIDLAAVLAAWGGGKSQYDCDIDDDGIVGGSDLAAVLAGWGACP
jgi:hypothetical protein